MNMYKFKIDLIVRKNYKLLFCARFKYGPPSKQSNYYDPDTINENPLERCKRFIKRDFNELVSKMNDPFSQYKDNKLFPKTVDILIIGGGVIGSSIAYWIQDKCRDGISIAVVEKDLSYSKASSALSAGGIRQQFSLKENVELSMYSAEFLRNIKDHLSIPEHEPPNVNYNPSGYLYLATEKGANTMLKNHEVQKKVGAKVELLSPEQMKIRFPWLNINGIVLGSLGTLNEGWFDAWSLLDAFRKKAKSLGTYYVEGEVIDFGFKIDTSIVVEGDENKEYEGINSVKVKLPNGELQQMVFGLCIIAAGADSGKVAQLAKLGNGKGFLSTPLPIEPRKRFVYYFHAPKGPSIAPMVIDPSGLYFRPDGFNNHYICGKSPDENDEPDTSNLDVDHEYFEKEIWSQLAHRVPAFEEAKVKNSWAGYYDYNWYDQNAVIGPHPSYFNLFFATGFSGHGIQQAPAVGRAIMEMITESGFNTIDLTKFGFGRLIAEKPLYEVNVI
ncbi:FAD-dependent oxidoreductase domain-containing protein 1-like isoform X2 [Daktulosphaira vitifoliae]|uniref:FAD-dependent oxidoreductase domain-containing protein 1-like isoform X2 n=1 Tax=Daktulosphaira vitifoliae TaxID=58002 RepID=UPI0021A9BA0D|nr:FAD-dependent oxidoreductase domain-containing protein 1-like isoform X2 [Daktulosphaira vitifoliae]